MSARIDNAELMSLLESSDIHTVNEVKNLIRDQLNTGKEIWLVNTVVDSFVESNSTRCLELLAGLKEPHDKHLFDRMLEHWKSSNKIQVLMIVGHLVRREPSWLPKLASHQLMQLIFKTLKSETDNVTILTGALTLTALLPVVPTLAVQQWTEVCELFGRLVAMSQNKTGSMASSNILHSQVTTNIMFNRLYGMYPCHFLTYLRGVYSRPEAASLFNDVIKPLLCQVRMHPLLITATKDKETMRDRWRNKDVHDIMVECAQLSLDLVDGSLGNNSAIVDHSQHEQRRYPLVKKASFDISNATQVTTTAGWSPSNVCDRSTPPANVPRGELKPSPLVLSTAGVENASADSPLPLTPFVELNTPKNQLGQSFDFSKVAPGASGNDESALDLSGRFMDGVLIQKPAIISKCDAATQTQFVKDSPGVSSVAKPPTDRSTSTDNSNIALDGSDTSGSPVSGTELDHMTSASVAAFVKKVKRIRFNSITVAKDHQMHSALPPPRVLSRSISCPDVNRPDRHDSVSDSDLGVSASPQSRSLASVSLSSPVVSFRAIQASPVHIVKENVATQTALYVNGYEAQGDATPGCQLVPYELLATMTLPYAPFLQCYACLRRSVENDKRDNGDNIWRAAPIHMSQSPEEMLGHYLDHSVAKHAAALHGKQSSIQASPEVLLADVRLLQIALLYERHRREVYARRNLKLLSRIAHFVSVTEQNEAIRDQLSLQEAEMKRMKEVLLKEQQTNIELKQLIEHQKAENELQLRNASIQEEEWKNKLTEMEDNLKQHRAENASLSRDLESAQHSLFLKGVDLDLLQKKADGAVELKEQISQLNIELMLMGELHQKYQQRLTETTNLQTADHFNLHSSLQSATAECNDLRAELKHLKVEYQAAASKLSSLEEQLKIKDLQIQDQKQLLEQTKAINHAERQNIQDKLKISTKQHNCQQQRIFELESELAVLKNSHPYHRVRQGTAMQYAVVDSSILGAAAAAAGKPE